MRFVGEMSISEVAKEIREKVPNAGGADHGIFQPGNITQKPRWLKPEKTIRFYDLHSGVTPPSVQTSLECQQMAPFRPDGDRVQEKAPAPQSETT